MTSIVKVNPFQKAVKHEANLRLAIAGPSGSGKTYSSLKLASELANGHSIALVDTEHGSAEKYADIFNFDTLALAPPYHPDRFVDLIQTAGRNDYGILILDSLSHAWNGTGGLLEIVDQIAARMKTTNTFMAWKDATPIQNRLVEAIVSAPLHIIATMRSKQEYVIDQVEKNGCTISVPRKVGMAPVQRDSFEYEFDIFVEMDMDNNAIVTKTRCPAIAGKLFPKLGSDLAETLQDWLRGAPATPRVGVAPNGVLIYLNGTIVDPTNEREVKSYCGYLEIEGLTPPSRIALKEWAESTARYRPDSGEVDSEESTDHSDDLDLSPSKEVELGETDISLHANKDGSESPEL